MKIIIIGSGLLGVTTAYELGKRGHKVVVLERKSESAAETSYANGGQLSYSHGEPWANPHVLAKLVPWMFRSDAPLVLRPRIDMQMMKWGLGFLRNCTQTRANINCVTMLRLGLYSREKMAEIIRDTKLEFDYADRGILHIYGTEHDFEHAKRQDAFQAKFGCRQRILTAEECYALEPSLKHSDRKIVGGIHAFMDASGDAYLFCKNLALVAAGRYDVTFQYGVDVKSIRTEDKKVVAVSTSNGDMDADAYIMAMGSYSPLLLRPIGIDIPIYPMKGYSITLPANEGAPVVSITDGTHKLVYSRLGSRLRVAGTAEFAGHNQSINKKRVRPIVDAAKQLFPKAEWDAGIQEWACLRPSTPDGPPVVGHTPYQNLFLNTGHGTLGWTQAAGSASIVADVVERKLPEIMLHGLTMERYR